MKKPFASLRLCETKILLIVSLFIIVITLEFTTPPAYVFGYLYIGAILLVNVSYHRKATLIATVISVLLTLLNLYIHIGTEIELSTVANRLIATLSLIVTGWLSNSNRHYQKKLIEQQTKLQSQEKLVQLRQDFASTLTHDLRTPLLGAIETIKAFQGKQFGEITITQEKVLATMIRSHQSSLQLVESLLDVYRNDLEGLKLNLSPLDLTILTEEVTNSLAELASVHQVYVLFNYGESDFRQSLWVNGDTFQLKRVLTNLLINAINHSRRGDRIEIILSSQSTTQVVKILDHGSGIKPEDFPFLFDRFYQSNSDRQAKGTGLGLYLCRQIIEAHGGKIWAENHSKGAIFSFFLPVYQG
ncbi:sensor histidine kinase KdpD [Geminocystis sp. NIES-3709]|uniref:sensor histidine kinase n=1 Tax=Geminocystis sp. NIES-3709 TaxID=1617448 RepID=UPI0005FC7A1C|nr:ATP-binding protein [Geminocystis sp. NIES-3709]BAQ66196.1 two-component sensor histidine kinase [Geminocystis sp. NIES-3709]